jgi:nicotinate-nucleotide adenylyltransferase
MAGSIRSAGILGGTFDPPHIGHLILAECACDALGLDQVLFAPAAEPPHKHHLPITPVEHRVAMVSAAIANNPRFVLSDVDMQRPGPHYTADTLSLLHEAMPDTDLYFVMGGDSLHDIDSWHKPQVIIDHARLAVMRRPGAVIDLSGLESRLPGISKRVVFVDAPIIGISATNLRERLQAGHSIRYQVPDGVEQYINTHKLYRDSNHV